MKNLTLNMTLALLEADGLVAYRGSSQVLDRWYLGKSYIAFYYLWLQRPRDTDAGIQGQRQKDQVVDQDNVRI